MRGGSVTAKTQYTSASPAFEMKLLAPSSTNSSPSRRAVVVMEATSEPASDSVIAKAVMTSPARERESHASFWSSVPASTIGVEPSA